MKNISNKSMICLDLGKKRIGLAGCDPLGITITPLPAILRTSFNADIDKLKDLSIKRNTAGIIFGLPLDEKGHETYQSKHCRKEGLRIARHLVLPFAFVNEHSSTWEAKNKTNLNNDKTGKLDSLAAAIILEQWLREGPLLESTT